MREDLLADRIYLPADEMRAHGVTDVTVAERTVCVDRRRLWANWRNVRHNAGIRTVAHVVRAPFRRARPEGAP